MTAEVRRWLRVLIREYGVRRDVAARLAPVLERLAGLHPSDEDWTYVVHALAKAQRCAESSESRSARETSVLVESFLSELRKMDESLKVLGVFLERLSKRMGAVTPPARILH